MNQLNLKSSSCFLNFIGSKCLCSLVEKASHELLHIKTLKLYPRILYKRKKYHQSV